MRFGVTRRPPPLWVLLDILMLCVLALASMPMEERGVSYKFLGLPANSVLFEVNLPLNPNQSQWRYFDFGTSTWNEDRDVTPQGLENFLCDECTEFLPDGTEKPTSLMVSLPTQMRAQIHEAFFEACGEGDCAPTIYIDKSGKVSASPSG